MGGYLRPERVEEALAALSQRDLTIVAGGTDFYPARVGRAIAEDVLDIGGIAGLREIEDRGDHWLLGANVTWSDLLAAPLPACFDGLKRAAREVGGVQIQNAGTLVGNLCNASPAADGVPGLLALDALVCLRSAAGARELALSDFIAGNRRTRRTPRELVVGVRVPKPRDGARSTFLKLGARRYLVISIVMVAAVLELDGARVACARVAVGACSEVAQRLPDLEAALAGQPVGTGLADLVEPAHLAPLSPIDDVRAPGGYRRDAALTLVRRALRELAADAAAEAA